MSDVGQVASSLAASVQQQVATTVLDLANQTAVPVQELLEQAVEQSKGAAEEGKGQHLDQQA